MPTKKKVATKTTKKPPEEPFKCMSCGQVYAHADGNFYKNPYSRDYEHNDRFVHICIDCCRRIFNEYKVKHQDQRLACIILCAKLDVPYYHSLYESVNVRNDNFTFGHYIRMINGTQYKGKTFANTLASGELEKTVHESQEESEEYWPLEEKRAKNEVIKLLGRDPFVGYVSKDRKYLFYEFLQYLDDEDLLADQYKVSQLIQLLNNNNQINQYDVALSRLDPVRNVDDIKALSALKKDLVSSNEKIAKENGFSVKSRGDNRTGKGTLTGLMRDMRERDLKEIESNFYDQLKSPASQWAVDISMKSMLENVSFDENDVNDIIETQRDSLLKYQDENDELKEQVRLLKVQEYDMEDLIEELKQQIKKLGGVVDG